MFDGRLVLTKFRRVQLEELFRATDPELQDSIRQLRDVNQRRPIKLESLQNIPVLTPQLILDRPELLLSRVAVTSNIERYPLIPVVLQHARLLTGEAVLWWKKPLKHEGWTNAPCKESIYDHEYYGPILRQYFQRGSHICIKNASNTINSEEATSITNNQSSTQPTVLQTGLAMLLTNICPTVNLVNGSIGQLHSIIYTDESKRQTAEKNLMDYNARMMTTYSSSSSSTFPPASTTFYNEDVEVPMPDYVLIKFDDSVGQYLPKHLSCVPGECVIPLNLAFAFTEYSIIIPKSKNATRCCKKDIGKISYRQFPYEPAGVTTCHKLQGQGVPTLIMNLNHRPGTAFTSLSVNTWLVTKSRVSRTEDFIAFPFYHQKPQDMPEQNFKKGQVINKIYIIYYLTYIYLFKYFLYI
jgi:hypothetical protein